MNFITLRALDILIISTALEVWLRVLETNGRHLENLHLLSILTISPSSAYGSALAYQILSEWDSRRRIYDVISIFQDGGRGVGNLFPVSCLWSLTLEKFKDYLCTKFHQDISVHGWVITASSFWKQTAAILKCYICLLYTSDAADE